MFCPRYSGSLRRTCCRILPCDPAMASVRSAKTRLAYIDWMRGLACLLMFQTHCYDSWLGGRPGRAAFSCIRSWAGRFRRLFFFFWPEFRSRWSPNKLAAKESAAGADRPHHDPARRRNLGLWPAVPAAGIRDLLGMGAEKRSAPRRYPQHHRRLDDADGGALLDGESVGRRASGLHAAKALGERRRDVDEPVARLIIAASCDGAADLPADPSALDHLAPATGFLGRSSPTLMACTTSARRKPGFSQSFPGPRSPSQVSLSDSFCKARGRELEKPRDSMALGLAGVAADRVLALAGPAPRQTLSRLRLLAHQP